METANITFDLASAFESGYINISRLFMYSYQKWPCLSYILHVHTDKILEYVKKEYSNVIRQVCQYSEYNRGQKTLLPEITIIFMENDCLVKLAGDYCEILHVDENRPFVESLLRQISKFKRIERKKNFEINLVSMNGRDLELKTMDIKRTSLDLSLYYEDDLLEVDVLLRKRLNKKDDKGIVLLHGLPGTGKTTYLRNLIGKLKKKVMFLSPSMADQLLNPGFMDLLIDNPNSVLIIEDAENIMMDRRTSGDSSVSNLLNISDGLLADFLNVQVICTFNSSASMIDSALMRKGRLIAKYEFGKLSVAKAQRLSDQFGFNTIITHPTTIAEIANQHEKEHKVGRVEVIGFRKQVLEY